MVAPRRGRQQLRSTGGGGALLAVQKVTPEELEVAIANREKAILVDFFATWCGPCLLLAQELEKVAEEMGDRVDILKLDVDENPDLASALQIAGLPTMIFIGTDDSKPALRSEGLMTAETIKSILRKDLQVQ
ncbi:thioredoxin, chloroplastic [Raphidocelis subcapitata]|uniref:Thioredoxin, chloroplastic n=1 Tax=Raphidocelis subcapitata TaxID=307507 RepID=A0A2V0P243_9CHLO|nr:thioredoxin, chloroplastic [Raphidocelis subcapitata]|eukprot:GBF91910.1 thioredoxin, chloroplastic [Raphidocelis subcapitata]